MIQNSHLYKTKAYINGDFIATSSQREFPIYNPSNQELVANVVNCDTILAEKAIESAQKALNPWKSLSGMERSNILRKWFELHLKYIDELAQILTLEQGKPLHEAKGEIHYGASFIEWFAEEAKRVYGDTIPGHLPDKRIVVIKQPIGVVAAITPWNFPNAMITRKVAPALAAGCTVIIKPSELTPLSALSLGQLANEAGFPKGVFNVIPTLEAQQIGETLCQNPTIKKLSFTGSTQVGKLLMQQSASTVKKLSLELGGNAPFIVFEDADIDQAVHAAIISKFRNAGQTCVCANRIFVHSDVYQEFSKKLIQKVKNLKVGDGFEPDVDIGPLISEEAIEFIDDLVEDALLGGAKIFRGPKVKRKKKSLFYDPIVLTDVTSNMKIFHNEIFGPVAPLFKFSNEKEVIELANNTPYGLASYFFGKDHSKIWRVSEQLEYGMVGINTGMISTTVAPFGGIKQSGFGKEGSKYGIEDYIITKYLSWSI
ncbi:MAG: NAD-dependent succinate-semialdehyde dehydrogenase [Flavobacteriaceae bacterium]|nr:NAD-dependent succinate-semialdehyde dehydrogenase [Flavobacteriaceae bacterium]